MMRIILLIVAIGLSSCSVLTRQVLQPALEEITSEQNAGDDVSRLRTIDRLLDEGNFQAALDASNAYIEDYPNSYKGWSQLGWSSLKLDQDEEAKAAFDQSLSINPNWDNAYVGKGVLYRKAGELEQARDSYLKAVEILPDNAEAFSSLLVIELMQGNDEQAVAYGEKAWTLRKNSPTIPANLAIAYHYLGDTAKRDQFYQEAKDLGYYNLQGLQDIFEGRATLR